MDHGTEIQRTLCRIKRKYQSCGKTVEKASIEIGELISFRFEVTDERGIGCLYIFRRKIHGSIMDTLKQFDI
jgi:hypothetical protein